ncbi:MAG: hypothetical protein HWE11_04990 [Gammaproteobacteria bacterium]|nr:hypothetical protein [Gammaproteobacteria bacterium]
MTNINRSFTFCAFLILSLLSGCATYRPSNTENICEIFRGETDWYEAAVEANENWGTPIWVMMAIMHQESRFKHDVRAPRDYLLGFIPWGYKSSAYGFAQAKDEVWGEYQNEVNSGADRDDFFDAINFIGWYTHKTQRRLNVSKWDAYNQYLAYHEGQGGYSRGSYRKKAWLLKVAQKVQAKSTMFNQQLKSCKAELDDEIDSWF